MPLEPFPALVVRCEGNADATLAIEQLALSDLPSGEVVIAVEYSSLNYKDALACRAHRGVVQKLPHVPGIDCAGKVVESSVAEYSVGDSVLVTGYDLGSGAWGGYSALVRVPAAWVVALPKSLSTRSAMLYGTAGFTAAQCVRALRHQGIEPDRGEVVVTGATGGVGSIAVALLAKLGYEVAAVTGKPAFVEQLKKLGAKRVLSRDDVLDKSDKPLLPARWSAAVDTVGGDTLATLLRSMDHRGCVAACGLVGGEMLPLTVYPFILRGVALLGIDSAKCPRTPRLEIWDLLSGTWNVVEQLEPLAREVSLNGVPAEVTQMLAGQNHGRILVRPRLA